MTKNNKEKPPVRLLDIVQESMCRDVFTDASSGKLNVKNQKSDGPIACGLLWKNTGPPDF